MSAQQLVDDICADVGERLAGTGSAFVVLIWLTGQAGDPKALCIAHPPGVRGEVPDALATAQDLFRRKAGT